MGKFFELSIPVEEIPALPEDVPVVRVERTDTKLAVYRVPGPELLAGEEGQLLTLGKAIIGLLVEHRKEGKTQFGVSLDNGIGDEFMPNICGKNAVALTFKYGSMGDTIEGKAVVFRLSIRREGAYFKIALENGVDGTAEDMALARVGKILGNVLARERIMDRLSPAICAGLRFCAGNRNLRN